VTAKGDADDFRSASESAPRHLDVLGRDAVNAFRGSGPSEEQGVALSSASVVEYDVTGQRSLT
jgi:hypothetical protein